jgi:hypothetical protein
MAAYVPVFDTDAIRKVILDWVKLVGASSLTNVIFDFEAGDKPAKPYATVKIGPFTKVGSMDEIVDGDKLKCIRKSEVSVKVFANDQVAMSLASALEVSLEQPQFREPFTTAGISVLGTRPVMDVTTKLETKFERQALFEFTILFAGLAVFSGGQIETIDFGGTIGGHAVTLKSTEP